MMWSRTISDTSTDKLRYIHSFGVIILILALTGCSGISSFVGGSINTKRISITALPGANGDVPVAIDIVAVVNEKMIQLLVPMDASSWFSQKDKFQYQADFNVMAFEVVPGQSIYDDVEFSWRERRRYEAVFVFARMQSPGSHNLRIDEFTSAAITIGNKKVQVSEY